MTDVPQNQKRIYVTYLTLFHITLWNKNVTPEIKGFDKFVFLSALQLARNAGQMLQAVCTFHFMFLTSYLVVHHDTVEHTYDACPKYSKLGGFRIIAYLYVSGGSRR